MMHFLLKEKFLFLFFLKTGFFTLVFLFSVFGFSQDRGFVVPDSLRNKTFKELINSFYDNETKYELAQIYAKTYLQKGKILNDTLKIAEGFHFMSYLNKNTDLELPYLDSIIFVVSDKKYKSYPTLPFLLKADHYYEKRKLKEALNYYLKAYDSSDENELIRNQIRHGIGILKIDIGEYNAAKLLFNKSLKYFKNKDDESYLSSLFSLSTAHLHLKNIDTTTFLNKQGIDESLQLKSDFYYRFVLNEGVNLYQQGKYFKAIDSIKKVIKLIDNDYPNLIIANYYLGKANYYLGFNKKSYTYFTKVNDLSLKINNVIPELRDNFEILYQHSIDINDKTKQLYFLNRIVYFDSIINTNYKYINKNIIQKYELKKILSERDSIIRDINGKEKRTRIFLFISLFLLSISFIYFVKYLNKQRFYKKKFDELLLDLNSKKNAINISLTQPIKSEYLIPKEKAEHILKELNQFELNKGFLEVKLTQTKLAKLLNTNSTYLSKVINQYKNTSFSNYMNELRINYCIITLQNNKKLYIYTISALANEFGFNNPESFSKAFYAKTGLYPSYFIKQLRNLRI